MTPEQFRDKWRNSTRTEKSAAQEHFLDLCELLDVKKPAEVDPHGTEYTFEKSTLKLGGATGFADVWKKGCFAWEYKGPKKNLVQAYAQLKGYADALDNPPLLIVSDMQEIRIHTNFTNTIAQQHVINFRDLIAPEPRKLVAVAYGWPADIAEDDALARLLELNKARAGAASPPAGRKRPAMKGRTARGDVR